MSSVDSHIKTFFSLFDSAMNGDITVIEYVYAYAFNNTSVLLDTDFPTDIPQLDAIRRLLNVIKYDALLHHTKNPFYKDDAFIQTLFGSPAIKANSLIRAHLYPSMPVFLNESASDIVDEATALLLKSEVFT